MIILCIPILAKCPLATLGAIALYQRYGAEVEVERDFVVDFSLV